MKKFLFIMAGVFFVVSAVAYFYFSSEETSDGLNFNASTARTDIKRGQIWLVRVGRDIEVHKIDSVSQKYGFRIIETGRSYGDEWKNGVSDYNRVMLEWLENKNGKGWVQRFDEEVANFLDMDSLKRKEKKKMESAMNG